MSAQRPQSFARVYNSKHNAQSRLRACQEIGALPEAYTPVECVCGSCFATLISAFHPREADVISRGQILPWS
jgi:hypothetical protein